MRNQEFITWNLVVVVAYDGLRGCQSGRKKRTSAQWKVIEKM